MNRGFVGIGLCSPKDAKNVGSVLRAAGCYGVDFLVMGTPRISLKARTDTQSAWKHIPTFVGDNVLDYVPVDTTVVGIEITENARSLVNFVHPERAFYILGPEDGSIPKDVLGKCRCVVSIPTNFCMNLAATANVVLYDRLAKRMRN